MDRCALFVDAGYVLADGAMAVHGTRRRESVSWDYAGLLQLLASLAAERSGLPLLRCYWYEATVEGRRGADHDALADLPGVKLRLAKMRPGRREGVESEIHRDLATLARNKAVSDAMIISAEEDLAGVIADVQDLGMRVTMLHITVDGDWTISRTLRQECDDIVEINAAHLRPYAELISGAEPSHADEQDSPVGSAIALRRPAANGHGNASSAPAENAVPASPVPVNAGPVNSMAEEAPAGNGGVLVGGPANGGPANGAPAGRMPSFTPSAGGHDHGYHENGYHENGYHDNGYQLPPGAYPEYPEPAAPDSQRAPDFPRAPQFPRAPDFPRAQPPAGPGRPAAASGPGPAEYVGPGTDELPIGEEQAAASRPAIPASPPPAVAAPYTPAPQGDDAPTLYPMPAQAAIPMPPRADVPPRPEVYPAPVSAEAVAGQFAGEWADTRPPVPQYLDELIAAKPASRPYAVPDLPAYSPGASREPASGDAPQGEAPGRMPAGPPEQVPVPVNAIGPGAAVRHLPNGYSAGQPPAYGQPLAYGPRPPAGAPQGPQGGPGPQNGPAPSPASGPQPGLGGPQLPGPHPVPPPPPAGSPSMAAQSLAAPPMAPQPMGQQSLPPQSVAQQPAAPQPMAGPHPGQQFPIGAGPVPAGGPVPLNGTTAGNGAVPGNGMPDAYGMVPLNGLAQTSGLMAVEGSPPPGTGLTPVQGPPGAGPGNPAPGAPGAPSGPGGAAGPAGFGGGGQPQQAMSLADAVQSAHEEGQEFGASVARDAPALWLEAVLARKPRMPSDLEARLLQGSSLPIDFLLHDEVRHALRRGFWDALERARR